MKNKKRATDPSFLPDRGLDEALKLLRGVRFPAGDLPANFPEKGIGEIASLQQLAGHVFGRAARLGSGIALAHMDPPTPWITWAVAMWNASLNQNLLHESTSPFATEAEAIAIRWLRPYFGMQGGHFCAGSSLANLTGIWAARDAAGVKRVIASEAAHLSVEKACRLLGLELIKVPADPMGQLEDSLVQGLEDACLVLTAGTTSTGAIDPLELAGQARWTHVDAAWAGPLRLSSAYSSLLDGIERADSIAVSAHKWLFQPKDSAVVLFKDLAAANAAIGFSSGYLAKPNVGVQGSRSAAAIPLLATLLAWGRDGIARRLNHLMDVAEQLARAVDSCDRLDLWAWPRTAVTVFRPALCPVEDFLAQTPQGMFSTCLIAGGLWVRSVAANPLVEIDSVVDTLLRASEGPGA